MKRGLRAESPSKIASLLTRIQPVLIADYRIGPKSFAERSPLTTCPARSNNSSRIGMFFPPAEFAFHVCEVRESPG